MVYPPNTFATQPAGDVAAALLDQNFAAAAPLDGPVFTGNPTVPTAAQGDSSLSAANTEFVQNAIAGGTAIRQTVANGPGNSSGLPSFFPATSINLNLTSQNISASAILVVTAANGWSQTSGAPTNRLGLSSANLSWVGLTDATTNYLYVVVNADGTLTPGFTTLKPIYQWGGTPGVTNHQFTFNIAAMQGFLGNGVSAPQAYVVFVGEAVAAAGALSSTVAYAYNGMFESGFTSTLPGASTSVSAAHNLGLHPTASAFIVQCITPDNGFAAGDEITNDGIFTLDPGSGTLPVTLLIGSDTNTVFFRTGASGIQSINKGAASQAVLTVADWKYKFVARRGW